MAHRFPEDGVYGSLSGGVFVAMILGHWYLVTPKLPTGPALSMSRVMLGIVAFQLVLFGLWVAWGSAPTRRRSSR